MSPLIRDRGTTGAPLNHAADGCETEIAAALLDRGADVNGRDSKGWTPLQRALDEGCGDDFIGLLLDRGAHVDLISAVMTGDVERVRAILSEDPARIQQLRWDGRSALDIAVDQERAELETVLRDAGGTFNQRVQSMLAEVGPPHSVHSVLSQVTATRGHPGYMHLEPTASLDIRDQITMAAWLYRVDDGGGAGTVIGKWRQIDATWSYVLHLPRGGFHPALGGRQPDRPAGLLAALPRVGPLRRHLRRPPHASVRQWRAGGGRAGPRQADQLDRPIRSGSAPAATTITRRP